MREFFERFAAQVRAGGDRVALRDDRGSVCYAELAARVAALARRLPERARTVALVGPPGIPWIVADLAASVSARRVVPVPGFFTVAQVEHLLRDAAVDLILHCGRPGAAASRIPTLPVDASAPRARDRLPRYGGGAERVIYTSGTTGAPKGVLHGDRQIDHAVGAIGAAVSPRREDVHLSALPPSLLLEQVAGVLIPLAAGARVHVPGGAVGRALQGDTTALQRAFAAVRPSTTVLVPMLLASLVAAARAGDWRPPPGLRFAAVGGAPVPLGLVREARRLGIPTLRGYGLSECASVVAVERPRAPRDAPDGYCGTPLDGVRVRIEDGEVVVSGPTLMHGYLGRPALAAGEWRTGDTGCLTPEGGLCVYGRRDRTLVLPSGRNVSADWVEAVLLAEPRLRSATVLRGPDGALEAHLESDGVPGPGTWGADLRRALRRRLLELPAYARPSRLIFEPPPAAEVSPGDALRDTH